MSYKIENVNDCTRKITFELETNNMANEIKQALVEKQKKVNIKGFRKGKAPLSMVEKLYRSEVEHEALNKFITNQYYDTIEKEKINPIAPPVISNTKFAEENKVTFEAMVEIIPSMNIEKIEELSLTKRDAETTEEDINKMEKQILESKAQMEEIKDENKTLEMGLFAVINFSGKLKGGEELEKLKGEDFLVELGSNKTIKGFEENLVGLKKADKKDFDVTFPDDYHDEELKGKEVTFSIEVLELKEKKYPELNDELVKDFGHESVQEFKDKLKETITQEKENKRRKDLIDEFFDKVIKKYPFDVPQNLILRQKDHVKNDLKANLQRQGFDEKMCEEYFAKWDDDIMSKAQYQVQTGLIMDHLARKFEIDIKDEDIKERISKMAGQSGRESSEFEKFYNENADMRNNLIYMLREEKTVDKILELVPQV